MATATAKKGLGKGLSALMSEEYSTAQANDNAVATLPLDKLVAGKYQPRREFDVEALAELTVSIEKNGIMQPILVRSIAGGKYEIIAGERRFRAAKHAKLKSVPVLIRDDVNDQQALELALVENIQRQDLNPLEEATGYQRLMDEFKYTQDKLSSIVGKSRSHVANLLRLLSLPEGVKKYVETGDLTMGHARALIGVEGAEKIARDIVSKQLSVRETENLVRGDAPVQTKESHRPASNPKSASPRSADKSDDILQLERMLSDNLGLGVSINTRSGKAGEVTISYNSLTELDEVLRRLGGSI
ncbi:MAG: ParB/RepB/Spo0J family partition protein [Alphaproteobacteria bacterium]|nr:ParB/RepB/Spo0J family partition protein [Alphaproteobacteria bacterium]